MTKLLPASIMAVALAAGVAVSPDSDRAERSALPGPSPKWVEPTGTVLFSDRFTSTKLDGWKADRDSVWKVIRGMLRGDLPDGKQERAFLYAGSDDWTDYVVDLDVCAMRGVDKGFGVRVSPGQTGIAVDLRGPGYQDVLLQRREWPMGKVRVNNANGAWHHLRLEARGQRYRVWVNGDLLIDRTDPHATRSKGGIALAAYTGGIGVCTIYFDNVVVVGLN